MAKRKNGSTKNDTTTANLGFEAKLWAASDALRNNMDAAAYKHVVLGLMMADARYAGCVGVDPELGGG